MSQYSTGTVSVTNGSLSLTGIGTAWMTSGVTSGWLIMIGSSGQWYQISTINSDTSITLATNYSGTTVSNTNYIAESTPISSAYTTATVPLTFTTKTAAYTVTSADVNTLLSLTGSSYYAVTFNAPSGYTTGYYNIQNNDTRGKQIIISGGPTYILWPGQSDVISNITGSWTAQRGSQRYRWSTYPILYVDGVLGSTNTDGLVAGAGAFKTFQAAYQNALINFDAGGYYMSIYMAGSQTYTVAGDLTFNGTVLGSPGLVVDGGGCTINPISGTAEQNNAVIQYIGDSGQVTIQNMTIMSSYGGCISISYAGEFNVGSGVTFGPCVTSRIQSSGSGSVLYLETTYTVSGNAVNHYQAVQNGFLIDYAPLIIFTANTTTTAFAYADRGSVLQVSGNTYSAGSYTITGQRYSIATGANVSGTGGNINYFPGTTPGTSTTGYYN